jgi:hypothetical protein
MNKTIALVGAVAVGAVCSTAYALYGVTNTGTWPKSWPVELEPLRKQSRTLVGPMAPHRHYAIRFTEREEFETAWPHILKVKSTGAPVFLVRGPNFFLGQESKAGVVVHCPPLGQENNPATPEAPIPGVKDARMRWINTTYLTLVADGDIVDLNRIPLPADASIIDERFKDGRSN